MTGLGWWNGWGSVCCTQVQWMKFQERSMVAACVIVLNLFYRENFLL